MANLKREHSAKYRRRVRCRKMSDRGYALHSVCPQLSYQDTTVYNVRDLQRIPVINRTHTKQYGVYDCCSLYTSVPDWFRTSHIAQWISGMISVLLSGYMRMQLSFQINKLLTMDGSLSWGFGFRIFCE